MDSKDIRELFLDMVGGTTLEDDAVDKLVTDAEMLLGQITGRVGVDFMNKATTLFLLAMQYYYELIQNNFEASKGTLTNVQFLANQFHYDYVQEEQADFPNYMGDRG